MKVYNFVDNNQEIEVTSKTFERLMLIYSMAIQELESRIEMTRNDFKLLHHYDLIYKMGARVKESDSIIQKMKNRKIAFTYQDMVENINDIAGVRIVCSLQNHIFKIKDWLKSLPDIVVLKEKDYVTYPKKSGYSGYHLIVGVPVILENNKFYVKVEVQIRTVAMDIWSTLEHDRKYKTKKEITKKQSEKWVHYAKMIHAFDREIGSV